MKRYISDKALAILTFAISLIATACSQSESAIKWPNKLGATVKDGFVRFCLYAPGHRSVALLTDQNDWTPEIMIQSGDTFHIVIRKGPNEHMCYQYLIDDSIYIADPYSSIVLDRNRDWLSPAYSWARQELPPFPDKAIGQVSVCDLWKRPYRWRSDSKIKLNPLNMTIYEMDAFDFAPGTKMNSSFIEAAMNRVRNMGVNAVSFCPTNRDEEGLTSFPFAHDKSFGPAVNLKLLIDTIHQTGRAVFLDLDLSNISMESPLVMMDANDKGLPAVGNPWVAQRNDERKGNVATLKAKVPYVRNLNDSIITFWINEFHVDGIRLLNAHNFFDPTSRTNVVNDEKLNNLKHLANTIWQSHPDLMIICENSASEIEVAELAKHGFFMATDCQNDFALSSVGEPTPNMTNIDYKRRGWWAPRVAGLITPTDTLSHSIDSQLALKLNKAFLAVFLSVPGPKIIQRGQESWGCCNGHRFTPRDKDEIYSFCAQFFNMRSSMPVFDTNDFDTNLEGTVKSVTLRKGEEIVLSIANLDSQPQTVHLPHTISGEWHDLLSGKRYLTISQGKDIVLAPSDFVVLHAKP